MKKMKKVVGALGIATAALLGSLCWSVVAGADLVEAKGSVTLPDAKGDAQLDGGDPGKDVIELTLDSDGENLTVSVLLAESAAHYLTGHLAGSVVELSFDTDDDATTGGHTFWGKRAGVERKIDLMACIAYQDGGEACAGGLKGKAPASFFASYSVYEYAAGAADTKRVHDIFWKPEHTPIDGSRVVAKLPYAEIGGGSGKTLRIIARESDGGFGEQSFFPEVRLTLR